MGKKMSAMISVIVPVYNAALFLDEMIKSVLKQTYKNWELLLVENGSQDTSAVICKAYAQHYDQIHMIETTNTSIGSARNIGIEQAKGDYLFFVDADDYLASNTIFEDLLKVAVSGSVDIVVCNYERLWKGKLLPAASHAAFSKFDPNLEEFRFQGFFSVGSLSYVWNKLYRKQFLTDHALRFEEYDYAEDKLFNMECYVSGAKYAFLEKIGYVYRKNETSVSHQYKKDFFQCWMRIAYAFQTWTEEQDVCLTEQECKRMTAYTLFFAAFFNAKMEYMESKNSLLAVKRLLKRYGTEPLAKSCYKMLYRENIQHLPKQLLWRGMIRGFCFFMDAGGYLLLALGIKFLIDAKVDEHLSDTGKRE